MKAVICVILIIFGVFGLIGSATNVWSYNITTIICIASIVSLMGGVLLAVASAPNPK